MTLNLVSPYELARGVAKLVEAKNLDTNVEKSGYMLKTVLKVLSTVGRFISHSIRRAGETHLNYIVNDIPVLGQMVVIKKDGAHGFVINKESFEFFPSHQLM